MKDLKISYKMEQNNTTEIIKKLDIIASNLDVDNEKGKLSWRIYKPHYNEAMVKFNLFGKKFQDNAEFICKPEDALQVQALLVRLMQKTTYHFYEL